MRRYLIIFLLALLSVPNLFSQKDVLITGKMNQCSVDTLRLFMLDGVSLRQVAVFPLQQQEQHKVFSLKISKVPVGFYFLGLGQKNNTMPLILGLEDQIYVEGNCNELVKGKVGNSPLHVKFQEANQQMQALQRQVGKLIGEYRVALRAKRDLGDIEARMVKVDDQKKALLNGLKDTHPYLAKVMALQTYISFQSGGTEFKNEPTYFAAKYFQFVDFSDPDYNRIPQFHDSFKSYAGNLAQLGLSFAQMTSYIDTHLGFIPASSSAHKAALLGLAAGFQPRNEDAFAKYAAQYLELYPNDNPAVAQQLSKNLSRVKNRTIGSVAPEIRLPSPEGDTISLADYRGKYLLVDFWASWCGPCRRENPNVRRVYAAYKDKGFDILGVSLDRDKNRWVGAIEQDQLPWKHVSDLKQWRSIAAQTYGVSSIPYTVLLDPEGKIIAKRLRGASLERELERLLGAKDDSR